MDVVNSFLMLFMCLFATYSENAQKHISGVMENGYIKILKYLMILVFLLFVINNFILDSSIIDKEFSLRILFVLGFLFSLFRAFLTYSYKNTLK